MKRIFPTMFILFMVSATVAIASDCSWTTEDCTVSVHQHPEHWVIFTSCNDGSTHEFSDEGQHPFPEEVCMAD